MRIFALSLCAAFFAAGAAHAQYYAATGPQPKLPTEQLSIAADDGKTYTFTVELPVTEQQQDTGEMFRMSIPPGTGMLFMFPPPEAEHDMWMKNCPVPEDMIFIGENGIITHIAEDTVPFSEATISSGGPVIATLEVAGGTTAADDIDVGDKVIAKQFPGG